MDLERVIVIGVRNHVQPVEIRMCASIIELSRREENPAIGPRPADRLDLNPSQHASTSVRESTSNPGLVWDFGEIGRKQPRIRARVEPCLIDCTVLGCLVAGIRF